MSTLTVNLLLIWNFNQHIKLLLRLEKFYHSFLHYQKIGELYLKEWGLFNQWQKYFFVLTDIGLYYFKEFGSIKPLGFIPITDYLVGNKRESVNILIVKVFFNIRL